MKQSTLVSEGHTRGLNRSQKSQLMRYLKNCATNNNQTWQAHSAINSAINVHRVTMSGMHSVKGQGRTRSKVDLDSGVFRISVRRRRGAIGVEGVGCGGGGWPPPQKKNHFCPQNDKFGCIFDAVFNGRKHE